MASTTASDTSQVGFVFVQNPASVEKKAQINISITSLNPGRLFFTCKDEKCNFVTWCEASNVHKQESEETVQAVTNIESSWKNEIEKHMKICNTKLTAMESTISSLKLLLLFSIGFIPIFFSTLAALLL